MRVAVTLDAFAGATNPTVRIEAAGKSVEWPIAGIDGEGFEFALSAGESAPVRISEFEFFVDRPISDRAGERDGTEFENGQPAPHVAAQVNQESTPEMATGHEANAASLAQAGDAANALHAASGSSAPPGGVGLEVFTPPSVRRHGPDAHANSRAEEVAP